MKWTTELPKETGYYWYKFAGRSGFAGEQIWKRPKVVFVDMIRGQEKEGLHAFHLEEIWPVWRSDGYWSERLQEPD